MIAWIVAAAAAADLVVEVTDLRNDDGVVRLSLFSSAEGFPGEHERALQRAVVPIRGGKASHTFTGVASGTFAVAFVHDEDNDEKHDRNFMGVPTEGYGCSNNATQRLGAPRFEDAKFDVGEADVTLALRPRYWF